MKIEKRDGTLVDYNPDKIVNAIIKAMIETDKGIDKELAEHIALSITLKIKEPTWIEGRVSVEMIQDMVEEELMSSERKDVAKRYILYRQERNELRGKKNKYTNYKYLSDDFISKYKHKKDPFPTELGKFVYTRTYARPVPEENRRERWWETVARVIDYSTDLEIIARKRKGQTITEEKLDELKALAEDMYDYMYNLKLFPSGRTLWIGNTKAAYQYALSNFNCFSRDTEFITDKGVKSFNDFEDGDNVNVLNVNGEWSTSTVTNFGEDEIILLTLKKNNKIKSIKTTKNHIWFVHDKVEKGSYVEVETKDLQIGNQLREQKGNGNDYWTVDNIEYTGRKEEVWCVQEPKTNTFTLADDIITHNCSFLAIDSLDKLSEMFFVLMLGTGVGLSVERKYIKKLPKINTKIEIIHQQFKPVAKHERLEYSELQQVAPNVMKITVGDSKFAWSKSMEMYLDILTNKQYKDIDIVLFNYDNVRPKGEPLKTFGGTASGHTNLQTMFTKIDQVIQQKREKLPVKWQSLKPIDVLDIATSIAENVVSGGRQ